VDLLDYLRFLACNRRFISKALICGALTGICVTLFIPTKLRSEFQIGIGNSSNIELVRTSLGSSYVFVDYCLTACQIDSVAEFHGLSESQKIEALHNLFHQGLSITKPQNGTVLVSLDLPVGLVDHQFANKNAQPKRVLHPQIHRAYWLAQQTDPRFVTDLLEC